MSAPPSKDRMTCPKCWSKMDWNHFGGFWLCGMCGQLEQELITTTAVDAIEKLGTPGNPCRHCGYEYTSLCKCGGGSGHHPTHCPRCGCRYEPPINAPIVRR